MGLRPRGFGGHWTKFNILFIPFFIFGLVWAWFHLGFCLFFLGVTVIWRWKEISWGWAQRSQWWWWRRRLLMMGAKTQVSLLFLSLSVILCVVIALCFLISFIAWFELCWNIVSFWALNNGFVLNFEVIVCVMLLHVAGGRFRICELKKWGEREVNS